MKISKSQQSTTEPFTCKHLTLPPLIGKCIDLIRYVDQWGYNTSWGNTWIAQHDDAGRIAGKPVVFEEYGWKSGKQAVMGEWQKSILASGLAGDHYWQFKTTLPSGNNPYDDYAIQYSTAAGSDYAVLAIQHAKDMAAKAV